MSLSNTEMSGVTHPAAKINPMDKLTSYGDRYTHLHVIRFPGSFVKRLADVVVSLVVVSMLLSWLLPVLALLIKLSSKGPVFFVQQRTGRYNIPFSCYKLRSMIVNEQADVQQAVSGDTRITWVGRFLRKTSLDELPQFFNVLKGEMSLVGPRPHMLFHTEAYTERIEHFHLRHLVRPGITGLSQVEGYRGEIKDHLMLHNRLRLDLFYINKWNLFMDIWITFKTIKLVLLGDKNAY